VRAPESVAQIAALQPDLGVLADYGQIIPRALLDLPRLGILNVHPSMLPRHRGATPIQAAIAAGDSRTGVTIIRMDEGVDTGPIVATVGWAMTGFERAPDLEDFAAQQAADLLRRRLDAWLDGDITPRPQPEDGASVTRTLRREDGRLDPSRPAVELARQVRAHVPWPGSFIETSTGRLGVLAARPLPSQPGDAPGTLVRRDDGLAMTTVDGRLDLDEVQPAGGRAMSGEAFVRGHAALIGSRVEAPAAAPAGSTR
jgi:methionyl-tRNA formyltransferase